MREQLQQSIESMRKHVLKNLDLIKINENRIREVLNWPLSTERTKELNEGYKYSKVLLTENNDFINLQVTVMNFLNKYNDRLEDEVVKVNAAISVAKSGHNLSREDCFRLTVENSLSFDRSHPFYKDDAFFGDLLSYFQNSENYEMCAELIKQKE